MEAQEERDEPRLVGVMWALVGFLAASTVHELRVAATLPGPLQRDLRRAHRPSALPGIGPGQLEQIEGVGRLRALRIVRALWSRGPATGEGWLTEIEGVGESTAAKVWPFLVSRGEAHVHSDDASPCPSPPLEPPNRPAPPALSLPPPPR